MAHLVAKDLSFFYGKQQALSRASLDLKPGTLTALVGPNGAGKSTLLRLLQGQTLPSQGEILIDEKPLEKVRSEVALMPQRSSINWNFPITVEGLVTLGERKGSNSSCCGTAASLQRVGLSSMGKRRLDTLSGGQQQRALLARTLRQAAKVFLLDEPCAALDPPSREQFLTLIRQLADAGLTLLVSSHDWGESLNSYDKVVALDHTVMAFGTPDEVRSKLKEFNCMGYQCCG